jgi:hypothetical protein
VDESAVLNMGCGAAKINRRSQHDSAMMTPLENTIGEWGRLRRASWGGLKFLQSRWHGFTIHARFMIMGTP